MTLKDEVRACGRCKGEGTIFRKGFSYEGRTYPDKTEACTRCHGKRTFNGPDVVSILDTISTTRGASEGKRKLRTAWPSKLNRYNDSENARAYYCWRMIRFHSGADVTMPITATTIVHGDPFVKELDIIADELALKLCGDNMAGARRWGRALGVL